MELKMEVLVEYCLVLTVMRILSAFAAATSSCERIQIPECYGIGYDLWVTDICIHESIRTPVLFRCQQNYNNIFQFGTNDTSCTSCALCVDLHQRFGSSLFDDGLELNSCELCYQYCISEPRLPKATNLDTLPRKKSGMIKFSKTLQKCCK